MSQKGLDLTDELFELKLKHAREHYTNYIESAERDTFNVFELGTGWYPVIPVAMFLYGAESVLTTDLTPLLRDENVQLTLEKFLLYDKENSLKRLLPGIQEDRLVKLRHLYDLYDIDELLEQMDISAEVLDARDTKLKDDTFDLVISNNTFEHIYPEILEDILIEFKRICGPGSVMSHVIDLSDHFSHLDKEISPYNFLKFSDSAWKWIDNDIQPMNRLRINEYRNIYSSLEIPILKESNKVGTAEDLGQIGLDDRFADMPKEDVAVRLVTVVTKF